MQSNTFAGIELSTAKQAKKTGHLIILNGAPGSGKTSLLSDLQDCEYTTPILHIDAEGGADVLSDRDDIKLIAIEAAKTAVGRKAIAESKWKRIVSIFDALGNTCPFKSITLDNLCEIVEISIQRHGGIPEAVQGVDPRPVWYEVKKDTEALIRNCQSIAWHYGITIVITTWDAKDTVNGIEKTQLALQPSVMTSIAGIADHVLYLTNERDQTRKISMAGSSSLLAKIRRARKDEIAMSIPLEMWGDKMLCHLLCTLIGGRPFPIASHVRPARVKEGDVKN